MMYFFGGLCETVVYMLQFVKKQIERILGHQHLFVQLASTMYNQGEYI
jgi:hypothetical protein